MKKIFVILFSLFAVMPVLANEAWEQLYPGGTKIGNSVAVRQDYYEMKMPSGLSGRSVKDYKTTFRADISEMVRFIHEDGDLRLRGSVSRMNMEYTRDILDVSVFKSKDMQSGASACMDCHGANMHRTTATIGIEKIKNEADPYKINALTVYLSDSESTAIRGEIDHWMNARLMLKGAVKAGKIEQANAKLDAKELTLGLGGYLFGCVTWSGDLKISKVEGYKQKKTLVGRIDYKVIKGLKLRAEAGAFLDGYTQFGTEFAEIGMGVHQVRNEADRLPNLFNKLKNDKFGYWSLGLEYEHRF